VATAASIVGWLAQPDRSPQDKPPTPFAFSVSDDTLLLGDAQLASVHASFRIVRGDDRLVVELARGKVELAVAHREGRLVIVRAGDTEIEDVGTKFSVDYDGVSKVDVKVAEGKVKVTRHHKSDIVEAGSEWHDGSITLTVAVVEPPNVVETKPVPELLHPRHAAVLELQTKHVAPAAPPTVARSAEPARDRPASTVTDPYVDLKVAIRIQPIAFDPKLDGKGDAAAEIGRLKKTAYSPTTLGDDASLALYRIAVLLHRPLGQDTEALRTLEIHRRRFAAGKEHAAAEWLRVRILCLRAVDDECRKAAYTYQHDVAAGETTDVAVRITNAP
jgi:hypothetical protein